ncbi:MAG TPA: hypothetical protein VGE86_00190, partial [Thermoanaerobaculia bacterium]
RGTPDDSSSDADVIVPAWLLAIALLVFFALITLGSIEPFHYDGVGRHLAVSAALAAYLLVWKEIFRRYLE